MERNPNDPVEPMDAGRRSDAPGAMAGDQDIAVSSTGAGTTGAEEGQRGIERGVEAVKGKVGQAAQQAKEQARQRAGQAKEKAVQLRTTLADKLDEGATRLRERSASRTGSELAEAPTGGNGATSEANRTLDKVSGTVASGMHTTAEWLRTADLETMKGDVERQVRSNPGKALFVALGLGYVLGRVFRGRSER